MSVVTGGTYEGTGAAINLEIGFIPDYAMIVNAEDGDILWHWFNGMGAGDAVQITNHADTQVSLITSNGVTSYDPADLTNPVGLTVGTTLSESGKTYYWRAELWGSNGAG